MELERSGGRGQREVVGGCNCIEKWVEQNLIQFKTSLTPRRLVHSLSQGCLLVFPTALLCVSP